MTDGAVGFFLKRLGCKQGVEIELNLMYTYLSQNEEPCNDRLEEQ